MRRRRCSDGRDRGRFRADAAFCVGHRVIIYRLATGGPFPDRVRPYILGQFILVAARTPFFFAVLLFLPGSIPVSFVDVGSNRSSSAQPIMLYYRTVPRTASPAT